MRAAAESTTELADLRASRWAASSARWLAIVLIAATAIEAHLLVISPIVARDGLGFIEYAQAIDRDPIRAMRTHDQHPGYPALVSAVERGLPIADPVTRWLWAARLASASCGLVCVLAIWCLARELSGSVAANLAAATASCLPLFMQNATDALSDTSHLAFYLLAAWTGAVAWRRQRLTWLAACGAASGIAFWMRPEGLSPAIVLAGAVAFSGLAWRGARASWGGPPTWRASVAWLAVLSVAAGGVVLPYVVLTQRLTGKLSNKPLLVGEREQKAPTALAVPGIAPMPVPSAARNDVPAVSPPIGALSTAPALGPNLPHELRQREQEAFRSRTMEQIAVGAVTELCGELVQAFRYVLLLPLIAGVVVARRVPDRRALGVVGGMVLWQTVLLLALYYVGGYISHRHVMPVVALTLPWVGLGCSSLYELALAHPALQARPLRTAVLGMALLTTLLLPRTLRPINESFRPLYAAGEYLRAHARPGDTVLSNTRHANFYAGLNGLVLVEDDVYDVATALRLCPFSFIALDVGDPLHYDPQWLNVLSANYERVAICGQAGISTHHRVEIYRRRAALASQPLSATEKKENR